MKVGDRVRVKESIIVYHHPEHRNQSFDIKGGEVVGFATNGESKPISANRFYVQFSKNSRLLRETELELLSSCRIHNL